MADQEQGRKPTRKERELQFRLNIVLDAAMEVFSEKSFGHVSVEEIATRAEISVGTLYNLFHSKEEVYTAVVSRSQGDFLDTIERLLGEARGPREQILAVVRGHLQHFANVENAMKIYISATNGFQWELRNKLAVEVNERLSGFEAQLVDICQVGMDEGIFKKDVSAQDLAAVILGVPHSFLMAAARNDPPDVAASIPVAEITIDRLLGTD